MIIDKENAMMQQELAYLREDEAFDLIERVFPVFPEDHDFDSECLTDRFGPRGAEWHDHSSSGTIYAIDVSARWVYFNGFRFKTVEDAVFARLLSNIA
jgi:hypothetical protein